MSEEIRAILEHYAAGRHVCECDAAYAEGDGFLTKLADGSTRPASSCTDGNCRWYAQKAMAEVLPKIINDLKLLTRDDQEKLTWLDKQVADTIARAQACAPDYKRDVIRKAFLLTGLLQPDQTPSQFEMEYGEVLLESLNIPSLLATAILDSRRNR